MVGDLTIVRLTRDQAEADQKPLRIDDGMYFRGKRRAIERDSDLDPPLCCRSRLVRPDTPALIDAKSQDRSSATYPEGSSWCRHGGGTMKTALQNYQARMRRVLDYIDRHLDRDLDLETVSGVAAFSKFHFHRQFTATFGLSVHRYVQLARMKRASYRLAYMDAQSVTDIAMDAGYDAPDAFARAFRQRFGQSPSSFRKSPDWEPWLAAFGPLDNARSKLMQKTFTTDDVTIREVPPRRWRSWSIGATRRRSAPPSSGSSRGARPRACTPDKSDLQCLAFRAASCVACRL